MEPPIFLHYTKTELDRNFDQRGWVGNALEVIDRYAARSAATRASLEHRRDIRYGDSVAETLDLFPASAAGAPVQIFVHGGAWRNFTKDDFFFPAAGFVPHGVHTVVLNFANLPEVRLPEMVAQVRRGIEWVYRNAARFGGDPQRIHVSAQSSGAHLAAMALTTGWAALGLPDDVVKGATLLSGPYDLVPVMLSARSAYLRLAEEEVRALSPQRHADRVKCPAILVYAEHDTDEFQRQSREFAAALERAGRLRKFIRIPGVNHFELPEMLGDAGSMLVRMILEQVAGRK